MCKVRCWRWLFGNKLPISLWPGAAILARGVQRSKMLPALFDTLSTRKEGVLLICPDGRSASAFVSLLLYYSPA